MVVRRHIIVLLAFLACLAVFVAFYMKPSRELLERPEDSAPIEDVVTEMPHTQTGEEKAVEDTGPVPPASMPHIFDEKVSTVQRMKAVDALPNNQSTEVLSALRQLLRKSDEDKALRNNVANKLRQCGEPRLATDLTDMLWDEDETPKWRNYCVQHLFSCYEKEPNPAILDTLFKAAEADEKMVKICAVWSLSRIATPRDVDKKPDTETLEKIRALALEALREKNTHFLIAEAGVQSCARLGLTEALPEIRALAGSDETKPTHLRVVAIAALGELSDTESVPLLAKLSQEATGQVQAAAELALKRIGEDEEVDQPELAPEDRF